MTDFDQPAFAPESEKVARGAGLAQRSASGCAFQIKTRFKECLQKLYLDYTVTNFCCFDSFCDLVFIKAPLAKPVIFRTVQNLI